MEHKLKTKLDSLAPDLVLEAAMMTLSEPLGVDEFDGAVARVQEEGGLEGDRAQVEQLLADASGEHEEVARLLRVAMADPDFVEPASLQSSLAEVGTKQTGGSAELYMIGVVLVSLYLIHKTGGVTKHDKKIKVKTLKDGSKEIEFEEKIVKIDPFSPLLTLIKKLLGADSADQDDTPTGE